MEQSLIDSLTSREREILVYIAEGDSLPEIAKKLHRSLKTIESHRLSLGRKLSATNRVQLAHIAIASGLVSVPQAEQGANTPDTDIDKEQAWLTHINDATYNSTGIEHLRRFCQSVSQLPGVDIASICTNDSQATLQGMMQYEVLAAAQQGQDIEIPRQPIDGSVLKQVVKDGVVAIENGASQAHPDDQWLNSVGAESYLGIRLSCETGIHVGCISIVSSNPLENMPLLRKVISFLAPRIGGVLRSHKDIESLREINEQMSANPLYAAPSAIAASKQGSASHEASAALAQILRRVQPLAGIHFLRGIVDAFCDTFGVEHAGLCALDDSTGQPNFLRSMIYRVNGMQQDPFSYSAANTPCEQTLDRGMVVVSEKASNKYLKDQYFQDNNIESYIGARLSTGADKPTGVYWLLDRRPIQHTEPIEFAMAYFAPRISAELEQLKDYELLLQERDALESQLSTT